TGQGAPHDLGRAPSDQSAGIAGPAVADIARDGGRMVAPTGVNEELPGEPAKAGTAGVGTAEAEPSQAEETGEEAAPAAVVVRGGVVPQRAEPGGEEAKPTEAEPVEAELATAAVEAV